ncbi:hypothetical protein HWV62_43914 [Athelia sp. TMB]|nr:hypothetical protein HWV62_43914 [Athelia sp. TMB]
MSLPSQHPSYDSTRKPHPRWADGNFRDGDQSDRWHSRAAKSSPPIKRGDNDHGDHSHPDRLPSIKTETHLDSSRLYSFNLSSPASAVRYNAYQSGDPSPPLSAYEQDRRHQYETEIHRSSGSQAYPSPLGNPGSAYQEHRHTSGSNYSGGSGGYDQEYDDDHTYQQRHSPTTQTYCNCRSNPGAVHSLAALTHQLQNTTSTLRQFAPHAPDSQCLLYKRITELNNLIQLASIVLRLAECLLIRSVYRVSGGNLRPSGPSVTYSSGGALPTPETDVMSPISAQSSPFEPPPSSNGQDWGAIAAAGYNPYFPIHPSEQQAMYTN